MTAKKQLKFQTTLVDPFLDFTVQIEQVISDIFDDVNVTDDEVTDEKVTVEDVTDDEVTVEDVIDDQIVSDDPLSDDEEPEEISSVPANVRWDPKKQMSLHLIGQEYIFLQITVAQLGW